jgi:hypothetical protein
MRSQKPTAEMEALWAAYEKSLLAMLPRREAQQLLMHNRLIFERNCNEQRQMQNRFGSTLPHDLHF